MNPMLRTKDMTEKAMSNMLEKAIRTMTVIADMTYVTVMIKAPAKHPTNVWETRCKQLKHSSPNRKTDKTAKPMATETAMDLASRNFM